MTKKFIILFVAAAVLFIGGELKKQAVASETSGQEFFDVVQAVDGQEEFIESIAGGWAYVAPLPAPRRFLAAATGLDGTIYAIGGMYGADNNHADVYAYDPVANSWTSVAPMNYARNSLAAATGQDGKIYAIGGFFQGYRNWVEVYNPETNAWSIISPMPTGRYMLGAAAVDGKIYAIGGRSFWGSVGARVEMYDPETNTWTLKASMPTARYGLEVAVVDGKIYAFGGTSTYTYETLRTVEMYDPETNTWSTKSQMPGPRYRFGGVTGPDGNFYVIGGMSYPGHIVSGVMKYDPRTDIWSGAPGLPCQRGDLTAAAGPNATIYAIGGYAYCGPDGSGYQATVLAYKITNQPPFAVCKDIEISADENCQASIVPEDVDGGSYDPDDDPITLSIDNIGSLSLGAHYVNLTATDESGESDTCQARVTVVDTIPPIPYVIPLPTLTGECSVTITSAPTATDNCAGIITGITSDPLEYTEQGTYTVTWTYDDVKGNTTTQTQTVVVDDVTAPEISVSVSPNILRPPNHKMVLITPTINVSDNCDPNPTVVVTSITMNEEDETNTYNPISDSTLGDGHTINDIQVINGDVYLRAERSGKGTGRIYTITYTATDASDNSATATATVTVPHDQN